MLRMPSTSLARTAWRAVRREASWIRDLARRGPVEIIIETTRACNLRCFHCAVGEPGYHAATLSWDAFARVLPFLRRHRPLVHLNGHGETLLHGRFLDMFRAVIDCGCRVGFQTNGMLLTPELTRRLLDAAPAGRFAYLRFSVDAADKPLFDRIRAPGDFDTFLANARALREEMARRGLALPRVQLEMCAMRMNVHHLPALVRLTHELGGAELCVSDIIEYARARGQRLVWEPGPAVAHWREAERVARELGVALSVMPELTALLERAAAPPPAERPTGERAAAPDVSFAPDAAQPVSLPALPAAAPAARAGGGAWRVRECRDPWRMAFVGAEGDVRPCCVAPFPMGTLADRSLDEIWSGAGFRAFRRVLASRTPLPTCAGCFMRSWAPMPLALRVRELLERAARRLRPGSAARAPRWEFSASTPVARRGDTVWLAVSVAPGRQPGPAVDAHVSVVGADGVRRFLDTRGLSPHPVPLLLGWEPIAVTELAIATLRIAAGWPADRVTFTLTGATPTSIDVTVLLR